MMRVFYLFMDRLVALVLILAIYAEMALGQTCKTIMDSYPSSYSNCVMGSSKRDKIAKDRILFWNFDAKNNAAYIKKSQLANKMRKDYHSHKYPYIDYTDDIFSLYLANNADGLVFILQDPLIHRLNYEVLLLDCLNRQMMSLQSNHRERVIRWCKNHGIEYELFSTVYAPLSEMGNPCAMLALAMLEPSGQDAGKIPELKGKAKEELEHLWALAEKDIEYLEYVHQDLYLCGFCFEDQEYWNWLARMQNILDYNEKLLFLVTFIDSYDNFSARDLFGKRKVLLRFFSFIPTDAALTPQLHHVAIRCADSILWTALHPFQGFVDVCSHVPQLMRPLVPWSTLHYGFLSPIERDQPLIFTLKPGFAE